MSDRATASPRRVTWWPFAAACIGAAVFWLWLAGPGTRSPHPADADDARAHCEAFAKRAAHDSARFEAVDAYRWPAAAVAGEIGRWRVQATYRASNGFGAVRLTQATCLLDVSGDQWRLVDLSEQ